MASSSTTFARLQSACITCVRGGQRFVGRYRAFLLDPGTIFTLVSLLLLVAATIQTPDGIINAAHAHSCQDFARKGQGLTLGSEPG